jgi:hypothetical protein
MTDAGSSPRQSIDTENHPMPKKPKPAPLDDPPNPLFDMQVKAQAQRFAFTAIMAKLQCEEFQEATFAQILEPARDLMRQSGSKLDLATDAELGLMLAERLVYAAKRH